MNNALYFTTKVPVSMAGQRLDKVLADLLPDYSRARLQQWIQAGYVRVDTACLRGKDKVQGGEEIEIHAETEEATHWSAQALPLDVVYEDEAILVVNKPAGLVVHPGAGNMDGTLVNALLHYAPELQQIPRAGIVHRIDKDTSGLLVVAKTLVAHHHLISHQQQQKFDRIYLAIVNGCPISGGTVDAPIARHRQQRIRMAVVPGGRHAVTHYRILERFNRHSLLRVQLETGRTHQIRVHMAHIRYHLVGDPLYGGRARPPPGSAPDLRQTLHQFCRQALHAAHLGLNHPLSGQYLCWEIPLPTDMQDLLDCLRADTAATFSS